MCSLPECLPVCHSITDINTIMCDDLLMQNWCPVYSITMSTWTYHSDLKLSICLFSL